MRCLFFIIGQQTSLITYRYRTLWKWRSPLYVLAVALPMFVLTLLTKMVFFQLNSNIMLVVLAVYIAPFLSQSNKTLSNTCFASELYSLIHCLFGNFPCSRVDFMGAIIHQQKQLSLASINLALFYAATFTLSAQNEALCVMFKPMAVPSVNVSIITSEISI